MGSVVNLEAGFARELSGAVWERAGEGLFLGVGHDVRFEVTSRLECFRAI